MIIIKYHNSPAEAPAGLGRFRGASERGGRGGGGAGALTTGGAGVGRLAPFPRRIPALTSRDGGGGGVLDVGGGAPAVRCRVEGRRGTTRSYWVP